MKPTILIVDDNPENLSILRDLLMPEYQVLASKTGARALQIAHGDPKPELILLDVMMPAMDGYEVLRRLKEETGTRDIPVIFITALDAEADEERGFLQGAVDYISKPIKPTVVRARVRTHLELKGARDRLSDQNIWLEAEVRRRMEDNEIIQTVGIRALAHLAETRDPETGNHILRTQAYVRELGLLLRRHPRFEALLSDHYIDLLTRSAPLHDIGKVGIPDAILQKPGPLTPEEWTVMMTHAQMGALAIERAEKDAVRPVEFLGLAKEIAHWHHEKWDGGGYPDGLAGEAIPLSARIMAVADVFDALVSPRIYKRAMSLDQARRIMEQDAGRHFDPDVVGAFLADFDVFADVARHYRDPGPAGLPQ